MQSRGAPKAAVPTTTHPIPQLPSPMYSMEGVNLHFGDWNCLGGGAHIIERAQKGGALRFVQQMANLQSDSSKVQMSIKFLSAKLGLTPPPPPYLREIGTVWQIGVLTGKPCTFLGPKWVTFGVLALQKWGETFEGFGGKMAHSFYLCWCLQKWFSTGIYSINRASKWLWLETQETHQNGQNVHDFQVRTSILERKTSQKYLNPNSQ